MSHIENRLVFIHKEKLNPVFCRKMGGTVVYNVNQNSPGTVREILHFLSSIWK
jgi:hypothetical protein